MRWCNSMVIHPFFFVSVESHLLDFWHMHCPTMKQFNGRSTLTDLQLSPFGRPSDRHIFMQRPL
jgi:hypothetical protein